MSINSEAHPAEVSRGQILLSVLMTCCYAAMVAFETIKRLMLILACRQPLQFLSINSMCCHDRECQVLGLVFQDDWSNLIISNKEV